MRGEKKRPKEQRTERAGFSPLRAILFSSVHFPRQRHKSVGYEFQQFNQQHMQVVLKGLVLEGVGMNATETPERVRYQEIKGWAFS